MTFTITITRTSIKTVSPRVVHNTTLTCSRTSIKTISPSVVDNYPLLVNCRCTPRSNVILQSVFSFFGGMGCYDCDERQDIGCFLPGLSIVWVPWGAGVVCRVLVDEWKDTRKASISDGLARHWKEVCINVPQDVEDLQIFLPKIDMVITASFKICCHR